MSRKIFTRALVIILFLHLFFPSTLLAETRSITLSSSVEVIEVGSMVEIEVKIHKIQDLFGLQFQLNYNTDHLEYESNILSKEYDYFEGMVIDSESGTIFVPFIRKAIQNTEEANLVIASFRFKAKKPGKTYVTVSKIKAVSSETYINEFDQKDVKVIFIPEVNSITLDIKKSIEPEPAEPTPEKPTTPSQPPKDGKKDKEMSIQEIQEQLQKSIDKHFRFNPIRMIEIDRDHGVYRQFVNYDLKSYKIGNLEEQIEKLDKKITLRLHYQVPSLEEELLGLYKYDEYTNNWIYVKGAEQDKKDDNFFVEIDSLHQYAIMSYTKQYIDLIGLYPQAKKAIEVLTAKHILKGVDSYRYMPNQSLTRAEFATMLVNVMNLPLEKGEQIFTDVQPEEWYAPYIQAAYKSGLVQGAGFHRFDPESKITREQMAVMIERAYRYKNKNVILDEKKFTDDLEISSWAKEAVAKMKAEGIIQGIGDNYFAPKKETNRADAAVVIYRFLNKIRAEYD